MIHRLATFWRNKNENSRVYITFCVQGRNDWINGAENVDPIQVKSGLSLEAALTTPYGHLRRNRVAHLLACRVPGSAETARGGFRHRRMMLLGSRPVQPGESTRDLLECPVAARGRSVVVMEPRGSDGFRRNMRLRDVARVRG